MPKAGQARVDEDDKTRIEMPTRFHTPKERLDHFAVSSGRYVKGARTMVQGAYHFR
jgi:hypothetical protein